MYKAILILVALVLFGSYSEPIVGQATTTGTQPPTNSNDPNNPNSAAIVVPAPTNRNALARGSYKEGMRLAEGGQFSQAAGAFQEALRLDPQYADAYAALGRAYFKMREWQKATENLRRAIELNKTKRDAQTNSAGAKTLHPESEVTRQPEPQKQTSTPAQAAIAIGPETKLPQETNANVTDVKALSPESETTSPSEQQTETSIFAKATAPGPEAKLLELTNASVGVKTLRPEPEVPRQPEQRQERSTPPQALATSPEIITQETNANVAYVSTLSTESETTRQPEPRKETSTPAQPTATGLETHLTHETNAGTAGVKAPSPASETAGQPEPEPVSASPPKSDDGNALEQRQEPPGVRVAMNVTPASKPVETKSVSPFSTDATNDEVSLTSIYRVGPSDVLDVRLNDSQSPQSTLFTVSPSGLLEYPTLTEPLLVSGLTVEEIATKIRNDLKQRALIDDPKVVVGVRDYASHTILVSGLVRDPGTKFLKREAIPLYVVVADAQPLPEAGKVTILRSEANEIYDIELTQVAEMNLLIRPGDVITLHPNVTQFFYIGGEVKVPGERTYRRGLTLIQAIIAAGGVTPKSRVAEIDRDDGRGFLVGAHFDLKDIQSGKAADPLVKPGDRIMILR